MKIFEKLSSPDVWQEYLKYKQDHRHLTKAEEKDLTEYIENREYEGVAEGLLTGSVEAVPEKKLIRKMETSRKRTVYMYPREVNYVLKLMTFLLLRDYDGIFAENLYSFRVNAGVNKAMSGILTTPGLKGMYTYKVDISNYFNSIPVEKMCEMLEGILCEDREISVLLTGLLKDRRVLDKGTVVLEDKGVMAGTPFAVFLANVYLMEMDRAMESAGFLYARYSDDIMVFAGSERERDEGEFLIRQTLADRGLTVNESKEIRTAPGEAWSFLGIGYEDGRVDISPVSREKIKAKTRRKARAIKRWQIRKKVTDEQAVKAFIKAMNRKFFDPDSSHELTWARWYFPIINTDATLKELDGYMQQWIRFLATGKHNKKSYEFTYEDMKRLGYMSLVHEWYAAR